MKLTWFDLTKSVGLKLRLSVRIESFGRSANQLSQRELYSSGISLSHPYLMRHRSWRIYFAVRTKNARKPKGSKTGYLNTWMDGSLYRLWSETRRTPRSIVLWKPRWTGYSSLRGSKFLMSFDCANLGTVSRTLRLLLIHLVILKPPRESRTRKLSTCWIASEGRDSKQSST